QALTNLRGSPSRILLLEPDDPFFDDHRELIGVAVRPPAPIGQAQRPTVFVAGVDLVAGFPRDPELRAEGRHLLAVEQAGNEPETLVHNVTLLPRHALLL